MKVIILVTLIGIAAQFLLASQVHDITKAGNLDSLKFFLKTHPNQFDTVDNRQSTPLMFACDRGYLDIVKFMVEEGANLNKQDVDGDTPLIWAIAKNHYSIAEYLIQNKADVNILNKNHINALFWAIYRADERMVKLLIDNGIDLGVQDYEGNTALHIAGINQKVEIAKLLVDSGADLEDRESRGRTPLVLTAREHGNLEIIKHMIENGADVNSSDNYGSTALELTAWRGYEEQMNYILEKGAQIPEADDKKFILANFCCKQSLEKLYEKLDEKNVFDRILTETDKNLLTEAAQGDSPQIIGWLCDKGFAVNEPDLYGWTPLHYAAESGNFDVVKALVDKGANIDKRNLMGESAFNITVSKSNNEITDYLKSIDADVSDVQFPELKGDYLGQELPGITPEIFARGIVSSKHFHHTPVAFSPDGSIAVWPNHKPIQGTGYTEGDLYFSRRINTVWGYPQPMPFTSNIEEGEAIFSADGRRLYFVSRRTEPLGGDRTKENIWYVEVYEDGFSDPIKFDEIVNSNEMHWQISLDAENNVYIGSSQSGGLGQNDIYFFKKENDDYLPAENLGIPINTEAAEFNPIVSKAGDLIIFTRIGSEVNGLFISKKQVDGSWSEPHSMNDILPENALGALLSPDEKYMFFLARENENQGIYWVEIEEYIKNVK
ncbi:MAG: ankyrin repeat domain-containing protein [Candidatus Tenebribacter burtonii]|jgi:ankyrin repeat protein|nr:ankyrin repeat domain-containing protein [Candidatus Tenebribacter burtonii]